MNPGYSGTPLPKKLGIKERAKVVIVGASPSALQSLREQGVVGNESSLPPTEPFDVGLLFVTSAAALSDQLPLMKAQLRRDGGLWIAWPKKTSGMATDLSDAVVRETGLAAELVDNKVCAIDPIWSGLRFVWRVADRKNLV